MLWLRIDECGLWEINRRDGGACSGFGKALQRRTPVTLTHNFFEHFGGTMNITAIRRRATRWAEHDAAIPFRDDRAVLLNGTNPAGRRPRSLVEPQHLRAENDNREETSDAA